MNALEWPLSTLRLQSKNKTKLIDIAENILYVWKNYSNLNLDIHAFTKDTPHNTITPVSRFKDGLYELDLILRNNRTTDEHPLGIFHPHQDKHHIKKENIGLIEAIGLAILPARLIGEIKDLKDYYFNQTPLPKASLIHKAWFDAFTSNHVLTKNNFYEVIEFEIGKVFEHVLIDCGVFKADNQKDFIKFIEENIYDKITK